MRYVSLGLRRTTIASVACAGLIACGPNAIAVPLDGPPTDAAYVDPSTTDSSAVQADAARSTEDSSTDDAASEDSSADDVAVVDSSAGCAPAPTIDWRVGLRTEAQGDVRIYAWWPSPNGGSRGEFTLFLGKPNELTGLPISTVIACPMGSPALCGHINYGSHVYGFSSGTIRLLSATTPASTEIKATLSNVVMQKTSCLPTEAGCTDTLVAGPCYYLAAQTIDTTAPKGATCESQADCSSNGKVCDPASLTCAESQCVTDGDCGSKELCVVQYNPNIGGGGGAFARACYPSCEPASGCPGDESCVRAFDTSPTLGRWICQRNGSGTSGAACSPRPGTNSTGCASGLACASTAPKQCTKRCNPFDAVPGCASGERCIVDACREPYAITDVALDQACANRGVYCADDGLAYRGKCYGFAPDSMTCKRLCELGSTCPGGAPCTSLGVCP